MIKTVNRSTFKCFYCDTKNLSRANLIEHIRNQHGNKSGVCPICITESYGDPNYVCKKLLSHLELRHQFDFNEVIDQNETDEEAQLKRVMEESMKF